MERWSNSGSDLSGRCAVCACAAAVVCVQRFSLVHPYLLADNRHYTFYLWRKLFARYPHPSEGEITMVEPPMRMSRTPPEIRRMAPLQGADLRDVLAEAGVDAAEIEALKKAGAPIEPS